MLKKILPLCGCAVLGVALYADSASDVRRNLERMPKPWRAPGYAAKGAQESYAFGANTGTISSLTWERYTAALKYWDKKFDFFTVKEIAKSLENDPIFEVTITDPAVPADQKLRVAVVCQHTGSERSPLYAIMRTMDFLTTPEAAPYRKKFEIRFIPCGNNWGFFRTEDFAPWNSRQVIPYAPGRGAQWDIPNLKFKLADDSPEIVSFCRFIDDFQPEILVDMHGVGRKIPGETMQQYSGGAGSNHALAPWSHRLAESVNASIVRYGQATSRVDEEAERLISVADSGKAFPCRFRPGGDYFYTDMYAYVKYHTMPFVIEIGYEDMGLGAFRGVLDFGMNPPADLRGGYPSDSMLMPVVAAGTTPGAKRASRVELWNQIEDFNVFVAAPQYSYRHLYVVTLGKAGIAEFFGKNDPTRYSNLYLTKLLSKERTTPGCDWAAVGTFMELGPEASLAPLGDYRPDLMSEKVTLKHGIAFAVPVQIAPQYTAEMLDVRVNGAAVGDYSVVKTDTQHLLVIQVPPEKAANHNYFVISAAWNSNAPLETGWTPPAEILAAEKSAAPLAAPQAEVAKDAEPAARPDRVFIEENFDKLSADVPSQWNGVCSIETLVPGASEIVPYEGGKALKISGAGRISLRAPASNNMIQSGEDATLAFDLELAPGGSLYFHGGEQGKAFSCIGAVEGNRRVALHVAGSDGKPSARRTALELPETGKVRLEFHFIGKECFARMILPDGTEKTSPRYPRLPGGIHYLAFMSAEGKPGAAFYLDNLVLTGSRKK